MCSVDEDCGDVNDYVHTRVRDVKALKPDFAWSQPNETLSTSEEAATSRDAAEKTKDMLTNFAANLVKDKFGSTSLKSKGVAVTAARHMINAQGSSVVGNTSSNSSVAVPSSVFSSLLSNAGLSAADRAVSFTKVQYDANPFGTNVTTGSSNVSTAAPSSSGNGSGNSNDDGNSTMMDIDGAVMDFSVMYKNAHFAVKNA
eukprot:PhM_4_TR3064/c4_g1_i6/m.91011